MPRLTQDTASGEHVVGIYAALVCRGQEWYECTVLVGGQEHAARGLRSSGAAILTDSLGTRASRESIAKEARVISGIAGVDHVGIGVRDMERMHSFYQGVLGFDRVLGEMPMEDHPAIHGLIRAHRAVHRSLLIGQHTGDLTVALFHAVDPAPRPIREDPRYGDIGVAKLTFAVPDIDSFCKDKGAFVGLRLSSAGTHLERQDGPRSIYGRDPEGNLVEFVSEPGIGSSHGPVLCSVGIAVTDLERSLEFYRGVLGFDRVIAAPRERSSGQIDEITGVRGAAVRSCTIENSQGRGRVELIEATRPRGRSLPFGTQWGDFGYLQVCLFGTDRETLTAQLETEPVEVLLPPQEVEDPEHPAMFLYLRDPDGIPLEVMVLG